MILVDTSAWIEFLRDTGSPACERVDALLGGELATCDVIRMEVLAGARDGSHLRALQGLMARPTLLRIDSADYEQGARIYRICRRAGATVRSLVDCLIGAVALRHDVPILTVDADFAALAANTAVRIAR